jgi:hypothetical protein
MFSQPFTGPVRFELNFGHKRKKDLLISIDFVSYLEVHRSRRIISISAHHEDVRVLSRGFPSFHRSWRSSYELLFLILASECFV